MASVDEAAVGRREQVWVRSESERRLGCRARPSVYAYDTMADRVRVRVCPSPLSTLLLDFYFIFIGRDDPQTGHIWEHSDGVDRRRKGALARRPYPPMDGGRERGCERTRFRYRRRCRRPGVFYQTRHVQAPRNLLESVPK